MKLEYGDFYKFVASVGIALIAFAFLVPWLFLQQSFDIRISESELNTLTPVARALVADRQSMVDVIMAVIVWFSPISFFCGVAILGVGGWLWWTRTQKTNEKLNEANLCLLMSQLPSLTGGEVSTLHEEEAKAELEVEGVGTGGQPPPSAAPSAIQEFASAASKIHDRLASLISSKAGKHFCVLQNRRLGSAELDIVVISDNSGIPDWIIEVKYVRRRFTYGWLRDNLHKITYAAELYEREYQRRALPMLCVIGPQSVFDEPRMTEYHQRLAGETVGPRSAHINFIHEEKLDGMSERDISNMLKP